MSPVLFTADEQKYLARYTWNGQKVGNNSSLCFIDGQIPPCYNDLVTEKPLMTDGKVEHHVE